MAELDTEILRQAGKFLARRSFSRSELRAELLKLAKEAQVERILDRLQSLGLLNDYDYAYNFALQRKNEKGWGSGKIRLALISRGISASTADAAIERSEADCGETTILRQYLERHFRKTSLPRDSKAVQRLVLRLMRHGFAEESIRQVLQEMIPGALWQSLHLGE
jgi:regulatory protein